MIDPCMCEAHSTLSLWASIADAGSIPCEPLILLGRLIPDDSLGDLYSGEVVFSDGTSSIVCEVGCHFT